MAAPLPDAVASQPNAAAPQPNVAAPLPNAVASQPNAVPLPSAVVSQPNAAASQPNAATPQFNAAASQPNAATPQFNAAAPLPNAAAPLSDAAAPQFNAAAQPSDLPAPQPIASPSQPHAAPPQPNATAPNTAAPQFNAPAPQPVAALPQPNAAQYPYPQQRLSAWPGGPLTAEPPKGPWLAVAALVLGVLGVVVPFLPMNMDGVRQYIAFPFGVPGLILGVYACFGRRRGKPMAVIGVILSALALLVGVLMNRPASGGADDEAAQEQVERDAETQRVLDEDLNVSLGDVRGDTAANQNLTVTLYNKGRDMADFSITIELTHHSTGSVCETTVSASALKPEETYETKVFTCFDPPKPLVETGREVIQASKSNF